MRKVLLPTVEKATDPTELVLCIHCTGNKEDPCGGGPCYLCGGKGAISKSMAEQTIQVAESGLNLGSYCTS